MTLIPHKTIDKFMTEIVNDLLPFTLTKAQLAILKNSLERLMLASKLEQFGVDKKTFIQTIRSVFKETETEK